MKTILPTLAALALSASLTFAGELPNANHPTLHRTIQINGLDIFYREAGPKDAPAILLLHGFPTSSHMFRNENWEFDALGYMARRFASINDQPIREEDRKFRWPHGPRPTGEPRLADLDL